MVNNRTRPERLVFVCANPSVDRFYEVDRLTDGTIHRPLTTIARPGGKGLNAARAASTLGGQVTALAIVGGRSGEWIVDRLAQLGITARMAYSAVETRTCISLFDRSTGLTTELYELGGEIDAGAWGSLETIAGLELDKTDVAALAVSGSLPPGAPPGGYARLARVAAARSIPFIADAYGPALADVLAGSRAIVKVNAAEAGDATGQPVHDAASALAAARALRSLGAASVVITMGAAGAVAASHEGGVRIIPPDVLGRYPVGSGDSYLAGLAVALARGAPFFEAARRGMAAAIANALLPGAGDLDPRMAEQLLGSVRISD